MTTPAKGRWLQQISKPEIIFKTQTGRGVPTGFPSEGESVNHLSDEDLALIDLQPYVAPVVVPDPPTLEEERETMILSRLQFRLGLNAVSAQMRADFEAHVAGLDQNKKDRWRYSDFIRRNDTFIETLRVAVGHSEAQFDTFFRNSALL